jgi:hypothetical protein
MSVVLKGTKVQLSIVDEAFFGPNGRYRIIVRGLSKKEAREIIEAVVGANLVAKRPGRIGVGLESTHVRGPDLKTNRVKRLSAGPSSVP